MEPQAFEAAVKGSIYAPWEFNCDSKQCTAWSTVSVFDIQVELADWGAKGSIFVSARVGGSIGLWRSRNETEVSLDEVLLGIAKFLDRVACDLLRIRDKRS